MQPNSDISGWSSEADRVEKLRGRIDELDNLITGLIAERFSICLKMGEIKQRLNLPVRDEAREQQVMSRVTSLVSDPVLRNELLSLYEGILKSSRKIQVERKGVPSPRDTQSKITLPAANYFPQVTIIGLGLIGGALASLIKRHSPTTRIVAVDRKEVLEQALADRVIDRGEEDALPAVSRSGLIVLAAPPCENLSILRNISRVLSKRQLVVDVTSTKQEICALAANLDLNGADFIGGHPFFGSEHSGFEASRAIAPEGSAFCLVPSMRSSEMSLKRIIRWLNSLKLRPIVVSAEAHDRSAARTSHIIQLLAVLLGAKMAEGEEQEIAEELAMSGRSFSQLARLMDSPQDLWTEIFLQNADQIAVTAEEMASLLKEAAEKIANGDSSWIKSRFQDAKKVSNISRERNTRQS